MLKVTPDCALIRPEIPDWVSQVRCYPAQRGRPACEQRQDGQAPHGGFGRFAAAGGGGPRLVPGLSSKLNRRPHPAALDSNVVPDYLQLAYVPVHGALRHIQLGRDLAHMAAASGSRDNSEHLPDPDCKVISHHNHPWWHSTLGDFILLHRHGLYFAFVCHEPTELAPGAHDRVVDALRGHSQFSGDLLVGCAARPPPEHFQFQL